MGSETLCILPISLFWAAMRLCAATLNSFVDLASVLTTSTISINDPTRSWCLHLFWGHPTSGQGLMQDDLVMPDGNICLSLLGLWSSLQLCHSGCSTELWWSQGNLMRNRTLWPEYRDTLLFSWNSLQSCSRFSGSFDLATVQSCRRWGDKEKRKSSYIISPTEGNIFIIVCLSGLCIILCSIFSTLYYSIAKPILKL